MGRMTTAEDSPSLFTSARERRLWAWTLALVQAIYSTLGLARTLADELRNRELTDNLFIWMGTPEERTPLFEYGIGRRPHPRSAHRTSQQRWPR